MNTEVIPAARYRPSDGLYVVLDDSDCKLFAADNFLDALDRAGCTPDELIFMTERAKYLLAAVRLTMTEWPHD